MEKFEFVIEKIKECFNSKLPGSEAQRLMAPSERPKGREDYAPENARLSAVLLVMYPKNNSIYSVLMQRPAYPGVHGGQVSFPGGKKEEYDGSLCETALRESNEELGIIPESVEILGELSSLYIPHSNYMVYPYVGYCNAMPNFVLEPSEVEEVIEFPLAFLQKSDLRKQKKMKLKTGEIDVPYFDINNKAVWGATAMMLSEFAEVLRLNHIHLV